MKDIIYSKARKSYNRLNNLVYLPYIFICLCVVTAIPVTIIILNTQNPTCLYIWIGITIIGTIIAEIIADHYLKILEDCSNSLFEYSKYYNRKSSVKALKKQIRKNKKYLI